MFELRATLSVVIGGVQDVGARDAGNVFPAFRKGGGQLPQPVGGAAAESACRAVTVGVRCGTGAVGGGALVSKVVVRSVTPGSDPAEKAIEARQVNGQRTVAPVLAIVT